MQLTQLNLTRFRCFTELKIPFSPDINVLIGENGSGKTSVLEALAVLTNKRSFRTNRRSPLIQTGSDTALLVSHWEKADQPIRLAAQVDRKELTFRWGEEKDVSRGALLRAFPNVLIEPRRAVDLFHEAESRRHLLDETVFHVEHRFVDVWRRFSRALSQRNAALSKNQAALSTWDETFVEQSHELDGLRRQVFDKFQAGFTDLAAELSDSIPLNIQIHYRPGWKESIGLVEHLKSVRESEVRMGFSMAGPQRADIRIEDNSGVLAVEKLSRGQQKLIALALRLTQARLLAKHGPAPLLLWDDWQSELSTQTQSSCISLVREAGLQAILTTPHYSWPTGISEPEHMFHVEHPS